MKSLFKYLLTIGTLHALLLGSACSGSSDEGDDPTVDPPMTQALRLSADKETITSDGTDLVTFTVTESGAPESVDNLSRAVLVCTFEGRQTELDPGQRSFTCTEPGRYVFFARSGDLRSNDVTVTATPPALPVQNWYTRVLGMEFTGVGCPSCPSLAYTLERFEQQRPDELVVVSFHLQVNRPDPMEIPLGRQYDKLFNPSHGGTPSLGLAMRAADPANVNPITVDAISRAVDRIRTNYPAASGVAVSTTYDAETRKTQITARFISNTDEKYRYQIFLTEDGIDIPQDGAGADYRHDNTARATVINNIYGTPLNSGRALAQGVEVKASHTYTLDEAWDARNMRVVVLSLRSENDGNTWFCDNVAACAVGESVDYKYNE